VGLVETDSLCTNWNRPAHKRDLGIDLHLKGDLSIGLFDMLKNLTGSRNSDLRFSRQVSHL